MLTIRKEQMKALAACMREGFEERMVKNIAENFPVQFRTMWNPKDGDAHVRSLVQKGATAAESYGLEASADLAGFIHLMVAIAPDFDTQPRLEWMAKVLKSGTVPNRARMPFIFDQLGQRHPEYKHLRMPREGKL